MNFFQQNKSSVGIVITLGTEIVIGLLLWIGLIIAREPVSVHLNWFAACFIPGVFLLRYYIKKTECNLVVKAIMITLFVTFVAFMAVILNTHTL